VPKRRRGGRRNGRSVIDFVQQIEWPLLFSVPGDKLQIALLFLWAQLSFSCVALVALSALCRQASLLRVCKRGNRGEILQQKRRAARSLLGRFACSFDRAKWWANGGRKREEVEQFCSSASMLLLQLPMRAALGALGTRTHVAGTRTELA